MAEEPWTLARLTGKIQDDLELHGETFITSDDIQQFINDAIDDAEEIIIDCFSDFFLTYADLDVTAGQTIVTLPTDLYESRIRGIYYNEGGYTLTSPTGQGYKLRKVNLENVMNVNANDQYQYRLLNPTTSAQKLYIYPAIAVASDDQFRLWYVRRAVRLQDDGDILEKGIRPQYVLCHVKVSCMQKEGDPMLDAELARLEKQTIKLEKSLSRLTDDNEDDYLEPDSYAISEAFGDDFY